MNLPAASAKAHPFHWPAPPFHVALAASDDARPGLAVVQLGNGDEVTGTPLSIDPAADQLHLRLPADAGERDISMAEVRCIRLQAPLETADDRQEFDALRGAHGPACEAREFELELNDGQVLSGHTLGFRKLTDGLYLFPLADSGAVGSWFVPGAQIGKLQIGPLLGTLLQDQGLTRPEQIEGGLERQQQLRQRRIGDYLSRHALISAEDLHQALRAQRHRPQARLGDLLREHALISEADLQHALKVQAENRNLRLGEILVSTGAVSLRAVQEALGEKLGIPFVDALTFPVQPEAVAMLRPSIARQERILPLMCQGGTLVVAVDNPLDFDFEQELQFIVNMNVAAVIAEPDAIRARIDLEYDRLQASERQAPAPVDEKGPDLDASSVEQLTERLAREAPGMARASAGRKAEVRVTANTLVRLVNKIIVDGHHQRASDIHVESTPGRNTRIRFRVDGRLRDYLDLPEGYRSALVSRIKVMADLDIAEHRHAQDGKIDFSHFAQLPIHLRVAIIPTSDGAEDVVMRILGGIEPVPLDRLDLSRTDQDRLLEMIAHHHGLILVCGPTGSGKTTTLHSILRHINQPETKIWTAEDPVEINQGGLQVQINARIGWTFASAMRAFLRADPDVIMVGEMRDAETAGIAIEASLTGHLVFSTLHTNSAPESIVRLLELGMDPFNFADALIGMLSQRLARRLCPECKRARPASASELEQLAREYCSGTDLAPDSVLGNWRKEYGRDGEITLYEAAGCAECGSGYHGRIGIYELLSSTPEVQQLIRSSGNMPQIKQAAIAGGMKLLRQDALHKVLTGLIDLPSARAVSL